ncbi:MAG: hypothetical protein LBQ61_07750 [Spirochaetales bacterium]|jgi:hypothetical protein|nr:hypothetical protein [Spirochaetales bacterium]
MSLFMVCALPVSFFLIQRVFRPWREDPRSVLHNFLAGIGAFLPGLLLYLLFSGYPERSFSGAFLFLYYAFRDYLLWLALALLAYGLIFKAELFPFWEKTARFLAFLGGFFFFTGFLDLILNFSERDSYALFLLPMNRLGFLALAALILGFIGSRTQGAAQLAFFPAVLLAGIPPGLCAWLYYLNRPVLAWVLSPLFLALTLGGFILAQGGRKN